MENGTILPLICRNKLFFLPVLSRKQPTLIENNIPDSSNLVGHARGEITDTRGSKTGPQKTPIPGENSQSLQTEFQREKKGSKKNPGHVGHTDKNHPRNTPEDQEKNDPRNTPYRGLKVMHEAYEVELNTNLWHKRLGHQDLTKILETFKYDGLENSPKGLKNMKLDCTTCAQSKMKDQPFKTTNPDVKAPLDIVHLDLSGPIAPTSMQGNRYVTKFTDYYSRKITTYFSKGKTAEEVLTNLKTFIADTSHIGRVKIFRADQVPEYSQCRHGAEKMAYAGKKL
jgi:hypothetical protein